MCPRGQRRHRGLHLCWWHFNWGKAVLPPPGYAYDKEGSKGHARGISIRLLLAIHLLDLQQESSFAETFLSKIFLSIFQKKNPTE